MIVQFNHPIDGFDGFNPADKKHYANLDKVSGIYIYGLRQKIQDIDNKVFMPLYVGIAADLKKRLYNDHFLEESWPGKKKSLKEIFDFSKKVYSIDAIIERYRDMLVYDMVTNYYRNQRPIISHLKHIVWFQDLTFFNEKTGVNFFGSQKMNSSHKETYDKSNNLLWTNNDVILKDCLNKGLETKKRFDDDFYFVYATYADIIKANSADDIKIAGLSKNYTKTSAEKIELCTKKALNVLGINTTAKANGDFMQMQIDLSKVQSDLVNLGIHFYGKPYKNLII